MKNVERLIPGVDVQTELGRCTVFPMGVRHLRKFSGQLASIARVLVSAHGTQQDLTFEVIPVVISNALELVEECVVLEKGAIADLPHWDLAGIVETWVIENFGE